MNTVKGIIFDYGGTIDTNGIHWAEVIWEQYQNSGIGIDKQLFRQAYVHGERTLAKHPVIEANDTFHTLLKKKIAIHSDFLKDSATHRSLTAAEQAAIVNGCYQKVLDTLKITGDTVSKLSRCYPLVLVTNFYGNMHTVLEEFGLHSYFSAIIESSVVGFRKPDPALFALGVKALNMQTNEVLVVGDSYKKDIFPAKSIGCQTAWLKGVCWEEEIPEADANPDIVISSLEEVIKSII